MDRDAAGNVEGTGEEGLGEEWGVEPPGPRSRFMQHVIDFLEGTSFNVFIVTLMIVQIGVTFIDDYVGRQGDPPLSAYQANSTATPMSEDADPLFF